MPELVPLTSINLSDPSFWSAPRAARENAFYTLRQEAPVQFFEEWGGDGALGPPGLGYYSLTRYDDVWKASRNPEVFCSGKGVAIGDLPMETAEFFGSMITMDDPRHFRLRSIVSHAFTPREIARVQEFICQRAASILDCVVDGGETEFDFVEHVAMRLPLEVICQMMGIPAEDEQRVFDWTNVILGLSDPEYGGSIEDLMPVVIDLFAYASALGSDRRDNPRDDLTSGIMAAEIDGERLTIEEFSSFFLLLVVAGNETTRNAISHGLRLLTEHPDQRQIWFDDFERHTRTAVDEIVRTATPVIHFRRTVTVPTSLGGVDMEAGTKVVLWYNSANHDERAFADPYAFDVRRPAQPQQVGFGAGGPHFCLGANLARAEVAAMFDEIRRRVPDLHTVGEPDYLKSAFINGVKRQWCRIR